MNALLKVFFIFVFIRCMVVAQPSTGIDFTNPEDGSTHTITSGSTVAITVTFDYYVLPPYILGYIDLIDHNGTRYEDVESGDVTINLGAGNYTWNLELGAYHPEGSWEYAYDETDFTVVVGQVDITTDNNINFSPANHGTIKVDGINLYWFSGKWNFRLIS